MTLLPSSDAALLARSRADPAAFGEVFDRHAAAVHRYLSRRAGGQLADDLLAEVFTRAFAARDDYDLERSESLPWLYGIAANVLRSDLRARASEQSAASRWAARTSVDAPYDEADDRMDAQRQPVMRAVQALPELEREVLLLVAWEGLTPTQAARVLSVPAGTARSRLFRARSLLRVALDAPASAHDLKENAR